MKSLQRYFFEVSYFGKDFCGWQIQPDAPSVQETIEKELSKLHSNNKVKIVGCGRTDTGVHAHQSVFHVDIPMIENTEQFIFKLNKMLHSSIVIHSIRAVSEDFHARFSAKKRTYRYFIHHQKDAFVNEQSFYFPKNVSLEKMNEAGKLLLGTQDFTSLSKLHTDVKTNICTVYSAEWRQIEKGIVFEISADRFLRNMVRATVGTLLEVGLGKIKPAEIKEILIAKDRQKAKVSVPGHGLFLWEVEY